MILIDGFVLLTAPVVHQAMTMQIARYNLKIPFQGEFCTILFVGNFTTVSVTMSEWPGSASTQSPKGDIEPNHPSEI